MNSYRNARSGYEQSYNAHGVSNSGYESELSNTSRNADLREQVYEDGAPYGYASPYAGYASPQAVRSPRRRNRGGYYINDQGQAVQSPCGPYANFRKGYTRRDGRPVAPACTTKPGKRGPRASGPSEFNQAVSAVMAAYRGADGVSQIKLPDAVRLVKATGAFPGQTLEQKRARAREYSRRRAAAKRQGRVVNISPRAQQIAQLALQRRPAGY